MITKALIINFFEGKCDAREAAIVQTWLSENPDKLKDYLAVEEWEEFQPAEALSPGVSARLWNNIKKNAASPVVRSAHFRWVAIAASLLLVVGLSWQFVLRRQKIGKNSVATVETAKNVINNAPQKKTLTLIDGSRVELSPNSSFSYPPGFNSVKRDVILNGEANFDIAKDVARPFSVHGNSVVITVLGTRFTVNSFDKTTKVILQEGRVMVKVSDPSSQDDKKEYYLNPGDIFIYNQSAHVLHLEKDKDEHYIFNNYSLDVVFDQLQIIYNVKIIYNKADLGNRTFIGKIDKKDPLDHILKSITLLTKFDLHQQGDSFIIRPAASPY